MIARTILMATMILTAGPVLAADTTKFASAKDKATVFQGNGKGMHLSAGGVDWWTAGEPSRRFSQVGTIRDRRKKEGRVADAVGSVEIAKLALAKGGHALIVSGQETRKVAPTPVFTFGAQTYGPTVTSTAPIDEVLTTLAVIKYVE